MDCSQDKETKNESEEVKCTRNAPQNFGILTKMESVVAAGGRKWKDIGFDVMMKIFQSLSINELTSGVSRVCSSWRIACCDPILWNTLDFGVMKSNFIKIPTPPYVWVADASDKCLMRIVKVALGLSRGNVRCLIGDIDLYLRDDHLSYIAERSPNLKCLVLPSWNRITKSGITEAVRKWPELESLTMMPHIKKPSHILEEISTNCKNFTQLKIMGSFNVRLASAIVDFLPKLKVLSLRCSLLYKEAVDIILENLEGLEVLNISHCLFVEKRPRQPKKLVYEVDRTIIQKASRLRHFFYCQDDNFCVMCQRMKNDGGYLRWYKYEENLWRKDEVTSMAC